MSRIHYEMRGDVALLRVDDGKVNAIDRAAVAELDAALTRAEDQARAVAWIGRPGRFCAGFDLAEMRGGEEVMRSLVRDGALLLARMLAFRRPIVLGCSGHALGMGALLLLAADVRIGAAGGYQIGLNEVSIGLELPEFAVALAEHRISRRQLIRAAQLAQIFTPAGAVDAGFLDRMSAPDTLLDDCVQEAERLGALCGPAFDRTRDRLNGSAIERIRASFA